MRSRMSRGVPEWSGGKELYMGSAISAIGTSFGSPVLYRDHRKGPGGPPDPFGGPGTLPVIPGTLPVAKTILPIYKSLPTDHSRTPRDVRDLIRDSEQHSVITYKSSL